MVSCANGVRSPPYTYHASSELVEIPYSPPPARVEVIPHVSSKHAVWIDGEWSYEGTRWRWQRGHYVVPEPGARYAPWQVVRGSDGSLYFCKGIWRDQAGHYLSAPRSVLEGQPGRVPVIDLDGEREATERDGRTAPFAEDAGP
jgi:hypothetical protein